MGKTVLNLEIPLNNSGPAGLGVTVIGRSGSRKQGDMGVFIKSVVPGGAASLVSCGRSFKTTTIELSSEPRAYIQKIPFPNHYTYVNL